MHRTRPRADEPSPAPPLTVASMGVVLLCPTPFPLPATSAASVNAKSAAHLPTDADAYTVAVATVPGSTGHLLIITMLLLYGAAMENVRVRLAPERREGGGVRRSASPGPVSWRQRCDVVGLAVRRSSASTLRSSGTRTTSSSCSSFS